MQTCMGRFLETKAPLRSCLLDGQRGAHTAPSLTCRGPLHTVSLPTRGASCLRGDSSFLPHSPNILLKNLLVFRDFDELLHLVPGQVTTNRYQQPVSPPSPQVLPQRAPSWVRGANEDPHSRVSESSSPRTAGLQGNVERQRCKETISR